MKASILLLALLSSQAFARGGDGGAFNGPTLSPISVPAQADHPITDDDIQQATDICFATGDSAHGVTSVLQQLMRQVNPDAHIPNLDLVGKVDASESANDIGKKSTTWKVSGGWVLDRVGSPGKHGEEGVLVTDLKYLSFEMNSYGATYVKFSDDGKPVTVEDSLDTTVGVMSELPYVTAEFDINYLYDKWGNVIKTSKVMSNVRIVNAGKNLAFRNSATQRPVPLMIDVKSYVQCLQGEMQNLAAKH